MNESNVHLFFADPARQRSRLRMVRPRGVDGTNSVRVGVAKEPVVGCACSDGHPNAGIVELLLQANKAIDIFFQDGCQVGIKLPVAKRGWMRADHDLSPNEPVAISRAVHLIRGRPHWARRQSQHPRESRRSISVLSHAALPRIPNKLHAGSFVLFFSFCFVVVVFGPFVLPACARLCLFYYS